MLDAWFCGCCCEATCDKHWGHTTWSQCVVPQSWPGLVGSQSIQGLHIFSNMSERLCTPSIYCLRSAEHLLQSKEYIAWRKNENCVTLISGSVKNLHSSFNGVSFIIPWLFTIYLVLRRSWVCVSLHLIILCQRIVTSKYIFWKRITKLKFFTASFVSETN